MNSLENDGFISYKHLLEKLHCQGVNGIDKKNRKCRCVCLCECDEKCKTVCSYIQKVLNLVNDIMDKVGEKDQIFKNVKPSIIGSLRYM